MGSVDALSDSILPFGDQFTGFRSGHVAVSDAVVAEGDTLSGQSAQPVDCFHESIKTA